MKKVIRYTTAIMVCMMVNVMLFAQKSSIVIKKPSVDVGSIKEGETAHINFEAENPSSKTFRIYSVTTTCGCTIAKYPDKIGPKQKVIISATFNSKGFSGPVKKELVMVTNDSLKYYKMEFIAKVVK